MGLFCVRAVSATLGGLSYVSHRAVGFEYALTNRKVLAFSY